ncbi:HAMP domain-containing protein [Alteromonadaceae bacterium M269]|nr:HAMP domain-containing protein [Alteromonadaceae bacterium M269]
MRALFLRFYLFLVLALVGLGWGIDKLYEGIADSTDITTDVEIHQGTFFLLNNALNRQIAQEHNAYLDVISSSFGFPVHLIDSEKLVEQEPFLYLNDEQRAYLSAGGIVSHYDESLQTSWFMQKRNSAEQVILFGPIVMESHDSSATLFTALFLVLLALLIAIWLWPISRGLDKLSKTASRFGGGELDARVNPIATTAIDEVGKHFNTMAKRIQKLIKSHKELSHAVSHELRTPIARIRFACEMAVGEKDEETRDKYLNSIDDNIDELDALVEELLTYAKFDREDYELNPQKIGIASLLEQVLKPFRMSELALEFELDLNIENHSTADFDQRAMTRLLDNLIRNAARYSNSKIRLSAMAESNQLVIAVEDDGKGIPEDKYESLFDPFVRLDDSRDRKSGGLGLGLTIVKRLTEKHGGRVSVGSSALGGACFKLTFPNSPL